MTGRVGVDTGGTFTDVVTSSGQTFKVLSTPSDPVGAVAAGLRHAGPVERLAGQFDVAFRQVDRSHAKAGSRQLE